MIFFTTVYLFRLIYFSGSLVCYFSSRVTTREKRVLGLDFAQQANRVFGNKYDYSEALQQLKHFYCKVPILCSAHGRFFVVAQSHLAGEGCPKCARKDERQLKQRQERVDQIKAGWVAKGIGGEAGTRRLETEKVGNWWDRIE